MGWHGGAPRQRAGAAGGLGGSPRSARREIGSRMNRLSLQLRLDLPGGLLRIHDISQEFAM